MKNLLKKLIKNKLVLIITMIVLCLLATTTTFAILSRTSTKGNIQGNTITIDASAEFSLKSNNTQISFNKAKDNDSIQIKLTNNTDSVLHYYYKLSFTSENDLQNAILVSYNGNFEKTLNMFTTTNNTIENQYAFIGKGQTIIDTLDFELHQAIIGSILDKTNININVEVYTLSANYLDYMYVNNEDELKAAINDVNSNLLTSNNIPTIVLLNNILLNDTYTLQNECNLVLNDNSITGNIILNSSKAMLNIIGDNPNKISSFNLTLTKYNEERACKLLKEKLTEKLKNGIVSENSIVDLTGTLKPYNSLIKKVGTDYDYLENDTLVAYKLDNLKVGTIQIGTLNIEFNIYSAIANIDKYLTHIPNNGEITTTDIYLPRNIAKENATIEWTSLNPSLMNDNGKITTNYADVEDVTILAKIKVNDTIYKKTFTFKLSVHNNEINFNNLVSEISPLVIYNSYDGTNQDKSFYYLPVVDENSIYDYRKSYTTPIEDYSYSWDAYRDIMLTKIEYSLIKDDNGNEVYDYIKLQGDNAIYLNGDTLNTYAQVLVTGYFNTGEHYSTALNIIIAVGTETEILEPAFKNVQHYLDDVDILYNIISSRIDNGMANEKASFRLPSYFKNDPNEFEITYSIPTNSEDIISSIEKVDDGSNFYEITLDPTKFTKTESTISLEVTVTFNNRITKTRNVYFIVPAILNTSDIGNASLFNTIKYQVFKSLPENEKLKASGFLENGNVITNNTPDYILIRDIVGDENYKKDYIKSYNEDNGYLAKLGYKEANYAMPIDELKFYINDVNNASLSTDSLAFDFTRLISWATGTQQIKVSALNLSSTNGISSFLDTVSDGKEYLTDAEINVLKTYYTTTTGKSDWDTIWNQVSEKAPGYVFTDTTNLNNTIKDIIQNVVTQNASEFYFKYVEVLQVVLNEKDHREDYNGKTLYFPNYGIIGSYTWQINGASTSYTTAFTDAKGQVWKYVSSNMANTDKYLEDETEYISEIELEIMKVFWINGLMNTNYVPNYRNNLNNIYKKQKEIVDAIDASVTWPVYFTSDGIGKLINYFYSAKDIKVGTATGYNAYAKNKIPTVTNLDSLNSIMNYFPILTSITVEGTSGNSNTEVLAAFLETESLNGFFNRLTNQNKQLINLSMKYCAYDYVNFDISNIKQLSKLQTIDVSFNEGLTNVSYLVNVSSDNYTDVNFQHIGTQYEFLEYTIRSLSSVKCKVSYTDDDNNDLSTNQVFTNNKALTYLNEFDKLISENMYLIDKVYGADTTNVYWRIESGNAIEDATTAGRYTEIDSVNKMNQFVSPYYYCTSDFIFDGVTFKKGYVYKISPSGTSISIEQCNDENGNNMISDKVNSIDDNELKKYIDENEIMNNGEIIQLPDNQKHITTKLESQNEAISQSTNVIFTSSATNYDIIFNCFRLYSNLPETIWRYSDFYLSANGTSLTVTTTVDDNSNFCLLTDDQAKKLVNGTFTSNDIKNGAIYLGESSFPNNTTLNSGSSYYIYFPYSKMFLSLTNNNISLNTNYSNMFKIYYSNAYYIYDAENTSSLTNTSFIKYESTSNLWYNSYYISYSTGVNNGFSDIKEISYSNKENSATICPSSFTLFKNDDTVIEKMNGVYEFGYDIVDLTQVNNFKEEYFTDFFGYYNTKYFYYNNCIYKIEYEYLNFDNKSRTYYYTEKISTYKFYYKLSTNDSKHYIDNFDVYKYSYSIDGINYISDVVPRNVQETSNTIYSEDWSSFDYDTWNTNFINNNSFDLTKLSTNKKNYISHITEVNNSSKLQEKKELIQKVKSGYYDTTYYRYVGTTGSESLYKQSTNAITSLIYRNGYGYKLDITNNELVWTQYGTLSQPSATSQTLDSILDEANTHLNDSQFGYYYGRYYAYSGNTMITANGNLYEKQHIYRLMLNSTNTAFEFVDVDTYSIKTNAKTALLEIVYGTIGKDNVGDIYYIQNGGDTYTAGFYKLTYNADSNSYGLMKFTDIEYDYTSLKFENKRIYNNKNNYLGQNDNNTNYGGTGGSFEVVISAFVRDENGNIITRKFKVTVTG